MTNKQIIAEVEKILGVKVVEDVYPDCSYFIGMRFENGKTFFVDKMTNGGKADVERRAFTDEEQMQEIKQRCEEIKEYVR